MKTTKLNLANDVFYKAHIDTQKNKQHRFNLKDSSVRGGEMLISNPRKWSQLEGEHLAAGLNLSPNCHSREGWNPESLR